MHRVTLLILLLGVQLSFAQRTILKQVDAASMQELSVLLNDVSKLTVSTNTQNKVIVSASIEGEFSNDLVVQLETNKTPWVLTTSYRPGFIPANDKLSAHKIMSITLDLSMPQDRSLFVGSETGHISLEGRYASTQLLLVDGNIQLIKYYGQGILKTMYGSITGSLQEGMWATTSAPKGTIINQIAAPAGKKLETVATRGNITLLKAKN